MAWFKVDDGLHDHRKTRRVRRSHPEKKRDVSPFGLWVLAGSWAGENDTAGFVPTEVLEDWDDDAHELAQRLVDAGLWWATQVDGEPGYGFHDWEERNPANEVESGKFGNHLRWHVNRNIVKDECPFCQESSGDVAPMIAPDSGTISPPESSPVPTRPDPSRPDPNNSRPSKLDRGALEADFTAWYLRYPRKVGKGAAAKAYRAARKKADAQTLLDALVRQLPELTEREEQYRPHPATWLNQERWADQKAQPQSARLPNARTLERPPDGLDDHELAAWYAERRRA